MTILTTLWTKWKALGQKIFLFQARLILGATYFLLIVPVAVLLRPIIKPKTKSSSSWQPKDEDPVNSLTALKNQ